MEKSGMVEAVYLDPMISGAILVLWLVVNTCVTTQSKFS
jgi:hypothetical protein